MTTPNTTLPSLDQEDIQRFWKFVNKHPEPPNEACWLWIGGLTSAGYGSFQAKKRSLRVHRLAFFLVHGIWSPILVCHTCDVPTCVNPAHLFEGTVADNARDKVEKGRALCGPKHWSVTKPERYARGDEHWSHKHPEKIQRGGNHWNATLTEPQVLEIRDIHSKGTMSYSRMAEKFGVSVTLIYRVVKRDTWKHI